MYKKIRDRAKVRQSMRSPVNGVVEAVGPAADYGIGEASVFLDPPSRAHRVIQIYIAPTDRHEIVAPVAGRFAGVQTVAEGTWVRAGRVYTSHPETKVQRLRLAFPDQAVYVDVEVGRAKYITAAIEASPARQVRAGERIGEILVGSRAFVYVPAGWSIRVAPGDTVEAGRSLLATAPLHASVAIAGAIQAPDLSYYLTRLPPPFLFFTGSPRGCGGPA